MSCSTCVFAVVIKYDAYGEGLHRWNSELRELAESCGFKPRLCRPRRGKTKGKVARAEEKTLTINVLDEEIKLKSARRKSIGVTSNGQLDWNQQLRILHYHPDEMDRGQTLYEHSEPGRRFSTVAGLVFFIGLTAHVIAWAAPWWFLVIPIVGIVGLGWMVIFNPISGCRIDLRTFEYYSGSTRCTLAVADIDTLRIIEWSEAHHRPVWS